MPTDRLQKSLKNTEWSIVQCTSQYLWTYLQLSVLNVTQPFLDGMRYSITSSWCKQRCCWYGWGIEELVSRQNTAMWMIHYTCIVCRVGDQLTSCDYHLAPNFISIHPTGQTSQWHLVNCLPKSLLKSCDDSNANCDRDELKCYTRRISKHWDCSSHSNVSKSNNHNCKQKKPLVNCRYQKNI